MQDFTFIFMLYNLDDPLPNESSTSAMHLNAIVNQLEVCDIPGKISIILIEHKPNQTLKPPIRFFKNTFVYEMVFNKITSLNERKEVFNFGARNLGSEDSLAGIFLLIKERYRSSKYVLFTYDHSNFIGHLTSKIVLGNIFTVMAEVDNKIIIDDERLNLLYNKFKLVGNNGGGVKFSDFVKKKVILPDFSRSDRYDMLTNAELANAITKAFIYNGNEGIEAIFFDTCYTANIDNLYLYARCADFIVAAEGELHYNSFHISNIINRFQTHSNTATVLKETIDNFEMDFRALNPDDPEYKRMIIAAFTLAKDFRVVFRNVFNQVLLELMNDMPVISKILDMRLTDFPSFTDCFNIFNENAPDLGANEYYTYCYDIFEVFETIKELTKDRPYQQKVADFIGLLEKVIFPNKYIGSEINDKQFRGLSIFLNRELLALEEKKKEQVAYNYSFFSDFQNDFARHTYWPEFIQSYQKLKIINEADS